jgi:hypothetical protein
MSVAFDRGWEGTGMKRLCLCEYGGDVVAEVTLSDGVAPLLAEMLELLVGETHYAVLEDVAPGSPE